MKLQKEKSPEVAKEHNPAARMVSIDTDEARIPRSVIPTATIPSDSQETQNHGAAERDSVDMTRIPTKFGTKSRRRTHHRQQIRSIIQVHWQASCLLCSRVILGRSIFVQTVRCARAFAEGDCVCCVYFSVPRQTDYHGRGGV